MQATLVRTESAVLPRVAQLQGAKDLRGTSVARRGHCPGKSKNKKKKKVSERVREAAYCHKPLKASTTPP
ncbi:hypothetical protein BRADI_3g23145v3 [Brachypodium distachyon]|uniref:Uncharacterized protein n=1 Tax=Brachypodium distachyon TaxID=15368 RepID=A0A0Q3HSE7_BRADI|nr:hypothetical protein BRADI_3g23145v3 [Brachypodium distachyon]